MAVLERNKTLSWQSTTEELVFEVNMQESLSSLLLLLRCIWIFYYYILAFPDKMAWNFKFVALVITSCLQIVSFNSFELFSS